MTRGLRLDLRRATSATVAILAARRPAPASTLRLLETEILRQVRVLRKDPQARPVVREALLRVRQLRGMQEVRRGG